MNPKQWLLVGALAVTMGASAGAWGQTYVYAIEGLPSPTGANGASVFVGARGADDVTATLQAYDAGGTAGDESTVTIPGKGFVRLNNDDLVLGLDTGSRKLVVMADDELNVSGWRTVAGAHAVALTVHHLGLERGDAGRDSAGHSWGPFGCRQHGNRRRCRWAGRCDMGSSRRVGGRLGRDVYRCLPGRR